MSVPEGTQLTMTERLEQPAGASSAQASSSRMAVAASTAAWSNRLLCLEALLLLTAVVQG